ncbi:MAG: Uma2 family endonuclease [Treponema sp.]|nr:Uma2 family endonuclease [Treponema sp.]
MADALQYDDMNENGRYTYADYLSWDTKERYQLINGEVFLMASPSITHQGILMTLSIEFGSWLKGKTCQVFASPLDVRLFPEEDNSDNTVVQPDLVVVCDNKKLLGRAVDGPPDLVIEVVSPSNSHKELYLKFQYYLEAGVREYWVIDPEQKAVQVNLYENRRYLSTLYKDNDSIPVTILPGLEIALRDLWSANAV